MTLTFICPQHRQWLFLHPQRACTEQIKNYDTAEYYRDIGQLGEAIRFAGCAYESAEIVLTLHAKELIPSILSFTASAILLADSLLKQGHHDWGLAVFKQTSQRLNAEKNLHFGNEDALICVKTCIAALQDGVDFQQCRRQSDKVQANFNSLSRENADHVH